MATCSHGKDRELPSIANQIMNKLDASRLVSLQAVTRIWLGFLPEQKLLQPARSAAVKRLPTKTDISCRPSELCMLMSSELTLLQGRTRSNKRPSR